MPRKRASSKPLVGYDFEPDGPPLDLATIVGTVADPGAYTYWGDNEPGQWTATVHPAPGRKAFTRAERERGLQYGWFTPDMAGTEVLVLERDPENYLFGNDLEFVRDVLWDDAFDALFTAIGRKLKSMLQDAAGVTDRMSPAQAQSKVNVYLKSLDAKGLRRWWIMSMRSRRELEGRLVETSRTLKRAKR